MSSHHGHQEPLQHDVTDLLALSSAVLGLLPQQLAQPDVAEPIFSLHVLALCPFVTAWATHPEDDEGGLEDVYSAQGRREMGWCLKESKGTNVMVSTAQCMSMR